MSLKRTLLLYQRAVVGWAKSGAVERGGGAGALRGGASGASVEWVVRQQVGEFVGRDEPRVVGLGGSRGAGVSWQAVGTSGASGPQRGRSPRQRAKS